MEKLIQEFPATADDGTPHVLYVYQDFLDAGTRGDPSAQVPGLKRIVTDVGLSVNRVDKGKYKVDQTGAVLTSSDANAP